MYQLKSLSLNKSGILLRIFCRLTEKVFICFCIDINETFLFILALMVNHKNILMAAKRRNGDSYEGFAC